MTDPSTNPHYWVGRLSAALDTVLETVLDPDYPAVSAPGRHMVAAAALVECWDTFGQPTGFTSARVVDLIRAAAETLEVEA